MNKKIEKKSLVSLAFSFILLFAVSIGVYALPKELIPLGRTTGMTFFSKGAVIVGFSDVNSKSPAKSAGLQIGDIITEADGKEILTNEMMNKAVENSQNGVLAVKAVRNGKELSFNVNVEISSEGKSLIGAFVRDSMAGIGTITFVNPENGQFGALGHGVSDIDTNILLPVDHGSLMHSNVVDVIKGREGEPGELKGSYNLCENPGIINVNKDNGVYGSITDDSMYKGKKVYCVASKDEIEKGAAYIFANVDGEVVERFDIEIIKIYDDKDGENRNMMIKVTDSRLLEKTGGIVQGMSGSPIIQNDKLIGAVTHVLVNDPTRGYGIFIENMIE